MNSYYVNGKIKEYYMGNKPKTVCEQFWIKQQSNLFEEYKIQHPNNNLIVVNNLLN